MRKHHSLSKLLLVLQTRILLQEIFQKDSKWEKDVRDQTPIVKQGYLHSGSPEILMSSCDTKFGTCFVEYLTQSYLLLHSHPLYSINNNNSKMYLAVLTFTTTLIMFSFFATAGIVTFVVLTVQTMVEI